MHLRVGTTSDDESGNGGGSGGGGGDVRRTARGRAHASSAAAATATAANFASRSRIPTETGRRHATVAPTRYVSVCHAPDSSRCVPIIVEGVRDACSNGAAGGGNLAGGEEWGWNYASVGTVGSIVLSAVRVGCEERDARVPISFHPHHQAILTRRNVSDVE